MLTTAFIFLIAELNVFEYLYSNGHIDKEISKKASLVGYLLGPLATMILAVVYVVAILSIPSGSENEYAIGYLGFTLVFAAWAATLLSVVMGIRKVHKLRSAFLNKRIRDLKVEPAKHD
jgi:hypothetical protein